MAGQVIVVVVRDAVQRRQASPGHGGEVVVLVVQADVVGEPVEGSVVGEGLGNGDAVVGILLLRCDGLVDVVLCNEVPGERVQTAGEERGEKKVEQRVARRRHVEKGDIEADLDGDVESVDGRQRKAVDGHRADGVEEDLEGAEERLAEDGV